MFRLHDKTRRKVCVAGFLLLCVVPTTAVVAWCAHRNRPGRVAAEAQRLSRQLGLEVSLDRFEHLRPGHVSYEGVELSDPESGRSVLRCRLLDAVCKSVADAQGRQTSTLELTAERPVVEVDALDQHRVARLGIALAASSVPHCQSVLDRVLDKLQHQRGCFLSDHNLQILTGQ